MAGSGSFEGGIGGVAVERIAEAGLGSRRGMLRAIEDFAIDNMRSLTIGASSALVLLAAALMLQDATSIDSHAPPQTIESPITGSLQGQIRVPQGVDWQAVRKPIEIMALQAANLDRLAVTYGARRSSRGDREDSLNWQAATPGGMEARIALVRHGGAQASGATGLLVTKFGPVEVTDMTFSDAGGASQACLAFRRVGEGGEPTLTGWQCAPQGGVVERPELACFIDRLTLLKSGDDQALRRFFTEAEPRRRPCPNTRTTAGRKPTWLDHDGRAPTIRGVDETTGSIGRPKR